MLHKVLGPVTTPLINGACTRTKGEFLIPPLWNKKCCHYSQYGNQELCYAATSSSLIRCSTHSLFKSFRIVINFKPTTTAFNSLHTLLLHIYSGARGPEFNSRNAPNDVFL
ncbi:hypothetical protein VNO77_20424 [Canavalia gladiata]|uniref:Uncharacterized protein n=1 Tax=Canavalia gladiata TaxID=3824 RepID=A0AAN9LTI7_CANGL